MVLKEVPYEERPREKMIKCGVESLTNIELVAVLLGSGTKDESVLEVAGKIVYLLDNITFLNEISIEELCQIKGIKEAKAASILAAVELGKRINNYQEMPVRVDNPDDVFIYFKRLLNGIKTEKVYAVYLDIKGKVISVKHLADGSFHQALIDSHILFSFAFRLHAKNIILVHNHPSGDATPSLSDLKTTKDLVTQAKILNIDLLDHIIIGDAYVSIRREDNQKKLKIFN